MYILQRTSIYCILWVIMIFANQTTAAQEIGGMPVNVAMNAQTFLLFPGTITDFDITDKENYTCRPRRDKGLIIIPKSEDAKSTMLVITEGNRTHRLNINYLASYDPNKHNLYYDLSNIKILRETAKNYQQGITAPPPQAPAPVQKEAEKKVESEKPAPVTGSGSSGSGASGSSSGSVTVTAKPNVVAEWQPLLDAADKAYSDKRYDAAANGYREVLKMNPGNGHSSNRLMVIEKIQEILFDEESAKQQQEEQLKKQYTDLIKKADNAFDAAKYADARLQYAEASKLIPDESYPNTRINLVDRLLEEIKQQEEEARVKAEKERQEAALYNDVISQGNEALKANKYGDADKWYREALKIRPNDKFALSRLADIDNLLEAKQSAEKEKELLAKEKEIDNKYKAQLAKADKTFAAKDYDLAREQYKEALLIKPGDTYAINKLEDIENLLAALRKSEQEKEALSVQKRLDDSYKSAVAKADESFSNKSYAEAKKVYQYALEIKPGESYPKNRLTEIDNILDEMAAKAAADTKRLQEELAIKNKYREEVLIADKALAENDFATAKIYYRKALSIISNDNYAEQKLKWMDEEEKKIAQQKIDEEKAKLDRELRDKLEQEALIAKQKQAEIDKQYNDLIAEGDIALRAKKYEDARKKYLAAIDIQPSSSIAKEKLNSLDELEEFLRMAAVKAQMKEKEEADRQAYEQLIAEADKKFAAEDYDNATNDYRNAIKLQPDAKYPVFRIEEIEKAKQLAIEKKKFEETRGLTVQTTNIPFGQAILFKQYPGIVFGNPPVGQKMAADYFILADTLANYAFSKEVLDKPSAEFMSDSTNEVALRLTGIYFNGGNAFLKLLLENHNETEFLAGRMQLALYTSKSEIIYFHPCYLSGFPYLKSRHKIDVIFAARAAAISDEDYFIFTLTDRLDRTTLTLKIPGSVYNRELLHQ